MNKKHMMKVFNMTEEEYKKSKYKFDNIIEPIFTEMFHELGIIDKNTKVDEKIQKQLREEFENVFKER